MRILILLLFPVAVMAAPLDRHENTHYYRIENCGEAIGLIVVPADGMPQVITQIESKDELMNTLKRRTEAVEDGYAARIEVNPECQDF